MDLQVKLDADHYNNFMSPVSHWKSWVWLSTIATIATATYVVSLFISNPFFETISVGQTFPIFRGFAIGCLIVAILKSSFVDMKESRQFGIGALYWFLQGKLIQACRRDSDLFADRIFDEFQGKFSNDDTFPGFLESIVDSELRSLPHSDKRKKELREPIDSLKSVLRQASPSERGAVYDSLLRSALELCNLNHIRKSLQGHLKTHGRP